ncbi:helix-turn-helix domain-containing protein [Nocardioides sp. SYSU D00038]|uniref:winged helix-turn-helix transcriptional regulator n=1 Tax=Nocardioides sp. SYSU D00038 TaxID=2812554 RepID=UPI001967B607|nr:helix-turn-helix domain-containing protein [Nocardioides sp. SYSU D00038]
MPLRLAGRLPRRRGPVGDACPIDRTLQVVGTRSAFLLLREAFYGATRFDDLVRLTGFTEAVAASRLKELVGAGLLERRPYREPGQRTRQEYVLTDRGRDLLPVLVALGEWSRTHSPELGGPTLSHDGCEADVRLTLRCAAGHDVTEDELVVTG